MSNEPNHSDEEFVGDESSDEFESENTLVFDAVEIPPPPGGDESAESEPDAASDDEADQAESTAPADDPQEEEDEDEPDNAVFDISELQPHARDKSSEDFGGPEDASEEQPLMVVSPSDEAESLPESDASDEAPVRPRETPLRGAYEYLQIRTPIAEFESYARARTEALVRLGDSKDAEIAALAMNLGTEALKRVMGAVPKETL